MDDAAFNTETVAADQLKSFIERIERLEEEKAGIAGSAKPKGPGGEPGLFCCRDVGLGTTCRPAMGAVDAGSRRAYRAARRALGAGRCGDGLSPDRGSGAFVAAGEAAL